MRKNLSAEEEKCLKKLGKIISELSATQKKDESQNKSLERIAYEAGLSKSYFYDLVQGKGNPSFVILLKLSDILETPLWKIFKQMDI